MKTNTFLRQVILLFIGFIGMIALGLNWHLAIAAWVTPVFLLNFTRNSKFPGILLFFIVTLIAGSISRTCFAPDNPKIAVHLYNGLGFAIMYSLPYIADRLLYQKNKPFYTSLIFPAFVVLFEYFSTVMIGSWGIIAHTQYPLKPLVQMVSVSGLFGLSFLVSWFGAVINRILENKKNKQVTRKTALIYVVVFSAIIILGTVRFTSPIKSSKSVKVAAINGETDIIKVFSEKSEIFSALANQELKEIPEDILSEPVAIDNILKSTLKAVKEGAKIIVWNEGSLILNQTQAKSLLHKIKSMTTENKVYILVSFLEENATPATKPFNNVSILITPEGKVGWKYLKSALHPVAEAPIINPGNFTVPVLDTEYGKLGSVICYDMEFTEFIRQAGQQNINIMLVPSFDWKEITPLHSHMAAFEAVQNGFALIRPNGKGLSAIYGHKGNKVASMNTMESGLKVLFAELPIVSIQTAYSKAGNILVPISLIFTLFFIFLRIRLKIKTKTKSKTLQTGT